MIIYKPGDIVRPELGSKTLHIYMAIRLDEELILPDRRYPCYYKSCHFLNNKEYCYRLNKLSKYGPCVGRDRSDGFNIYWEYKTDRDREIGEIFTVSGGTNIYKALESKSSENRCEGCAFKSLKKPNRFSGRYCNERNIPSQAGECDFLSRVDGKNVIFSKIGNSKYVKSESEVRLNLTLLDLYEAVCSVCPYEDSCSYDIDSSPSICIVRNILKRIKYVKNK